MKTDLPATRLLLTRFIPTRFLRESRRTSNARDRTSALPRHTAQTRTAVPQRLRISAGILAGVLLCSAASMVTVILGNQTAAPAGASRTTTSPIDGAAALRPDMLRRAQWPYADPNGLILDERLADEPSDQPPADDAPAHHRTANPAAGTAASAERTVRSFYALVDRAPERAVRMLSSHVARGQRAEVAAGWAAVAAVRAHDVHVRSHGYVLADVSARYADGTRLELRQLFSVGAGTTPQITHVRLLDARRSTPR